MCPPFSILEVTMKRKSEEKLFDFAYKDSMTGVYNRNAYEERLQKLRRNSVNLNSITVVVADLNGLKEINETYGHHTGDETIKAVSSCLMKIIGEKADIYRVGGDEFVCIAESNVLPHVSEFRDLFGFENTDRPIKLQIAIGYVRYDKKRHGTIDELIKDCEGRMCRDKKNQKQTLHKRR